MKKIIALGIITFIIMFSNFDQSISHASETDFYIVDNVLVKYYGSGGDVIIPDGVTEIADGVFYNCTGLKSVSIPSSVKKVGDFVFESCTNLEKVSIEEGLLNIGDSMFAFCTNLKDFTLPESILEIEAGAFCECTSLKNAIIPSKVRMLELFLFASCEGLDSITLPPGMDSYCQAALYGCRDDLLIYGYKDSYAETIAEKLKYQFVELKPMTINKDQVALKLGETTVLSLENTIGKIKWESMNPKVAEITDNGEIVPKKKGRTTVIAACYGRIFLCKVNVL